MTDVVVDRLWGFAHNLRHDGVDYGDYIEQITYLLFLKMADEQGITRSRPKRLAAPTRGRAAWRCRALRGRAAHSRQAAGACSATSSRPARTGFSNPATLAQLIKSVDETEWTSLKVDVKAAAFEGLLEKAAAEGKKGAGQYFTPRPLIQCMVRLIKPDPRVSRNFTIGDPACGTGGFLVAAYEWLKEQTGGAFEREDRQADSDQDLLRPGTRRPSAPPGADEPLPAPGRAAHRARRLDLRNPDQPALRCRSSPTPRSARRAPTRRRSATTSWWRRATSSSTSSSTCSRCSSQVAAAAIVVPDNVLFADQAGEVFKVLMEDCNVHTVLRCPARHVRAVHRGHQDERPVLHQGRADQDALAVRRPRQRPDDHQEVSAAHAAHFAEFERCYGDDPNGRAKRSRPTRPTTDGAASRLEEIIERGYKIDSFKWLRDEQAGRPRRDPRSSGTRHRAIAELQAAVSELHELQKMLDRGRGSSFE